MTAAAAVPLAYSVAGASRATGIGVTLIRAELKAGRLKKRYLNSKVVLLHDDLVAFLAALPETQITDDVPAIVQRD